MRVSRNPKSKLLRILNNSSLVDLKNVVDAFMRRFPAFRVSDLLSIGLMAFDRYYRAVSSWPVSALRRRRAGPKSDSLSG